MKIVFIADIVGEPGREMVRKHLGKIRESENADFVIVNGENSAHGKGLTSVIAKELFSYGVDVITLGNHTFDRKEIKDIIDDTRVIRPANYPPGVAGIGWNVYTTRKGEKVAVVNLMGRVYLPQIDCPFRKAKEITDTALKETKNIFVDFHAEITSEKQAMGWYLDGIASAVVGTHTHVQTADERLLKSGTAYMTDAGMTGPYEGVIGMDRDIVIQKYLTGIPHHFVVAPGSSVMQGCVVDIDSTTGRALTIKRINVA